METNSELSSGRSAVAPKTELAFFALMLGMLLAQLDTNIVVAALPRIGADLQAGSAIAGVTAAYLLTVTVTTPIAGKLGDILGRRAVFVGAVLTFAVGSLACALAPSMLALVAARALQGIGGAGLIVTAVSTLGVLFDRTELIRRQIWLTAVMAIAALAGPPLGGYLTESAGWPAIFLVNLPVCVLAIAIGYRGLPGRDGTAGMRGFDIRGVMLMLVATSGIVVLGSFDSVARSVVLAPAVLILATTAGVAFVRQEHRATNPLVPPAIFASPGLARSIIVTGISGTALFGTFTFVPLAVIAGTGYGISTVSTMLVALTAGQLVITATFSIVARKFPRVAAWGRLGLVLGVLGLGLLAVLPRITAAPGPVVLAIAITGLVLAGAALGLSMQAYTLLGITTAPPEHFGSAMATLTLFRLLGGSIGAAIFGWLLITMSGSTAALTAVLGTAALLLAAAIPLAPGQDPEPPTDLVI
ncbi:MFS transporter [Kribbella solani]|uniref:MFS transporter n=1 Tax=Kribbella solani TaxID=236067 RepID=UPI0029A2B4C0|nr:MFS transporter [Kribbella solani]MDX3005080.1 MFS transporter [Kribbella solani]